eukprot:168002-Hanusia_phi.AAC.1
MKTEIAAARDQVGSFHLDSMWWYVSLSCISVRAETYGHRSRDCSKVSFLLLVVLSLLCCPVHPPPPPPPPPPSHFPLDLLD